MKLSATTASSTRTPKADVRNPTPEPTPPKTATELLVDIHEALVKQNKVFTQTLGLLLRLVRERGREEDQANG